MLLAFVGITGIGKSYFAEELSQKLGFKKVHTIRTREKRQGEENGKTGYFMTEEELEQLKKQGKIAYDFKVFGGTYGYLKEEIFSKENYVFEMHYTTIGDWKKVRPDIVTIYLLPTDINISIQKIKERNLSKEKEQYRIEEVIEHYNTFMKDKELQKQFDYVIYNNYDKESEDNIIKLVEDILNKSSSSIIRQI